MDWPTAFNNVGVVWGIAAILAAVGWGVSKL